MSVEVHPPLCVTCRRLEFMEPCGSREFAPHMETGGNCSNCGHGLPCHPSAPEAGVKP